MFNVFKNKFYFRKILFFFSLLFFLLFNFHNLSVYAASGGDSFNPLDYKKDPQKRHLLLTSRFENGAWTDNNQRDFYSVDGLTPFFPCAANREWLNRKQAIKSGLGMIPFVGFALDVADVVGVSDKFIADKEQKVANLKDVVQLNLLFDPEKGCFFFDESELDKVKSVELNFCFCEHFAFDLNNIVDNIFFLKQLETKTKVMNF